MKQKPIKGFKAFNKGLVCNGFQYKEGEIFESNGLEICRKGFHFCENPLDVLNYYPLIGSEFAEIAALGAIQTEGNKSVTDKIQIGAKLGFSAFINASVALIFARSKVSKTGNATSKDKEHSATSGNDAHSATSGNDNIAVAVGRKAKAKASIGCFIVIAEWKEGKEFIDAKPIKVLSAKVDGKKVKADQWYKVVDGKFVETDDSNE